MVGGARIAAATLLSRSILLSLSLSLSLPISLSLRARASASVRAQAATHRFFFVSFSPTLCIYGASSSVVLYVG